MVLFAGSPVRTGAPAPADVRVLERGEFTIGWSPSLKHPLWVAYHVPAEKAYEAGKRPGFRADPGVPGSPAATAYKGTGYDRGHMAPNYAIATRFGAEEQKKTFYTSNIAPQRPGLNRGPWREIEHRIADLWTAKYGEIWVIVGCVPGDEEDRLPSGVDVPKAFWQVIIAQTADGVRALAVYMPKNIQKEAVQYIGRNIFDAPEWLYPADIINKVRCSPTYSQNSMQDNIIGRLLNGYLLNTLYTNASVSRDNYTVAEYLDDLFAEVWKPLNNGNEWKNEERRNLERAYLSQLDNLINPDSKASSNTRTENSDVNLYLLQHLNKIEQYLKAQQESGINGLHYQDLMERIQLIRDRRKSPNK
jgi:hypothetical protein